MAILVPVSLKDDPSRSYAFIDGEYLRSRFARHMERFYGTVPPVDFAEVQKLLGASRTYYYDAVNYRQGKDEARDAFDARVAAREAEHRYIASLPGFHVRNGFVRRGERGKNEQKAVDVQLAVDALEHAARGNMAVASLFAGDLDFEPLLRSLERLGVRTRLFHVSHSASLDLLEAADETRRVNLADFHAMSAKSFRHNHKELRIHAGAEMPSRSGVSRPFREGKWQGRAVTIYLVQDDTPRIYVAPGNELTEPQFVIEFPHVDKLLTAFELTFGEIIWNGPVEAWYTNNYANRG